MTPLAEEDLDDTRADALLEGFELLLREGKFSAVDALLNLLDTDSMFPGELLVVLTITFHGKEHLKIRPTFVTRAEESLALQLGRERAGALMRERR